MINYNKEVIASAMEYSAGLPTAMQSAFIEGVKFVLNRYMVSPVSIPSVRIANADDRLESTNTRIAMEQLSLNECIKKTGDNWRGIDADEWVREIRGYED